ncbi:homoserine O-acetyltransferase [Bacillus shivajii]|uniref:homoserine O-acetyltransferase MetX n=1 Tax=Bacillus shivajii TaxID=1983719 RepID=UPI001CFA0F5F|nr:homoserine O-acetyltransferase [Bacillus shivajii]UCZ52385.1 homoserine O-acetyltransferase [Bacillus shivajii]
MKVKQKTNITTGTVTLPKIKLDSGVELINVTLAYERAGPPNGETILVCHALTGNQHTVGTEDQPGWWRGLINDQSFIDIQTYEVITFNVLGGCNGSTGPTSTNPLTRETYKGDFPFITIRDIVRAQQLALQQLNINKLKAVIGGSLGGMQALEWAVMYPDLIDQVIVLAATPSLSDYGISYNAIARKAIIDDPNWNGGNYTDQAFPENGFATARMIGMITYRSDGLFNQRFHRDQRDAWGKRHDEIAYQVESYLLYQGEKFTKRFDPNSYLYLLKAMDHHDLEYRRGPLTEVLSRFKKNVQLIAFQGDLLYPPDEMKRLANVWEKAGANVQFQGIQTAFGHDGFLTEFEKWGETIQKTLQK